MEIIRSLNFKKLPQTKRYDHTLEYMNQILDNLSDKALIEIYNGYDKDVTKLLDSIFVEVDKVINFNAGKIDSANLSFLNYLEKSIDEQFKVLSYNYFKTTCLTNFRQNWRNLEWGNLVQLYPWSAYLCQRGSGKSYEFCYAFPLWRLFSYNRPHPLIPDTNDNYLRKETCIITNESRLCNLHISKIVEEIGSNDVIGAKVNPSGKANLGKESVTTENGAKLHQRSYGSFIRGLHVGAVCTDDFLDKSVLYSKDQRTKYKEVFDAEIKQIVEQGGFNLVSGTPFHQSDLYGDLMKDNMFKVFTYPGILPNMEILAPDRFTYEYLMEIKQSLGSIVFSREILVSPISDASSLFPWEFLRTSFVGMEHTKYVDDIASYPIKMERVVIGCDFAISGTIGADYTVYTVWGRSREKKLYLMHVWRKQGASHDEQVSQIISLDNRFKPNKIVCESNGFQLILAQLVKKRGVRNIKEHTTTAGNKKDLYLGLPSLSALFERGQICLPYAPDEETQNTTNWLCGEFNSITFNEDSGKLESTDQHDDGCMSSFFALSNLRETDKSIEMFLI